MVIIKQLLALVVLTTLTDQSIVIGIEKKEDKWHEKGGLASLYNHCTIVTLQSHDRRTIVALQLHDSRTTDLT